MYKIINTGGTFNKIYDPIKGELVVASDNSAVLAAVEPLKRALGLSVSGMLYKDSLDMDERDRELLGEEVCRSKETKIVVVHGTDTIDRSAEAIESALGEESEKRVVLTGAMVPFSIDPVEAVSNLTLAVSSAGFLEPGVYISMHGLVLPHREIVKNRKLGIFERVG